MFACLVDSFEAKPGHAMFSAAGALAGYQGFASTLSHMRAGTSRPSASRLTCVLYNARLSQLLFLVLVTPTWPVCSLIAFVGTTAQPGRSVDPHSTTEQRLNRHSLCSVICLPAKGVQRWSFGDQSELLFVQFSMLVNSDGVMEQVGQNQLVHTCGPNPTMTK